MRLWAGALGLWIATLASAAWGYGYDSPITTPCHETMTGDALREARRQFPSAAALETTASDALILDELVFSVPDDLKDIAAITLLVGVRDHDLKGESGIDTQDLAAIHGDNDSQAEHCLRRREHNEPGGSAQAAAECRELVRRLVYEAIDQGLGADGSVDGNKRMFLDVHLAFSRGTRLLLPIFYVKMGQALHTLQDAFSHTFRTADHKRITVALNWVDQVEGDYEESRDGPGHMRELDLCRNLDDFRSKRLKVAEEATAALLAAVFAHGADRAAKKRAVDAVLTEYMSFEPGCTFENGWCSAPERTYEDSTCTCQTPGGNSRAHGWPALVLLGLGLWRRGRR